MERLAVVIRCGNDPRVLDCIRSVDRQADVVVAFTGDSDLASRIEELGARCVSAPAGNLSRVSNIGFESTVSDDVVITDSDTIFEPRCLERLTEALQASKVARARLRFEAGGFLESLVAEAREFVNSLPLVYTPGLAVRREVIPDIGGFLFNDPIPYAVDADLDFRIRNAHIEVSFVPDAWIRHAAVPIRQDVRAAFRIGAGCRRSLDHWNKSGVYGHQGRSTLKGVKPGALPAVLNQKGAAVLSYQVLWDLSYWLGFFRAAYQG